MKHFYHFALLVACSLHLQGMELEENPSAARQKRKLEKQLAESMSRFITKHASQPGVRHPFPITGFSYGTPTFETTDKTLTRVLSENKPESMADQLKKYGIISGVVEEHKETGELVVTLFTAHQHNYVVSSDKRKSTTTTCLGNNLTITHQHGAQENRTIVSLPQTGLSLTLTGHLQFPSVADATEQPGFVTTAGSKASAGKKGNKKKH